MSIAVLMSLSVVAFASGKSDNIHEIFSEEQLSCIQNLLSSWMVTEKETPLISGDQLQLGGQIPVYEYTDFNISEFSQVSYYPVYLNNVVIGVLGVHGDKASPTYSFSQDWASNINKYLNNGQEDFCIIVTNDSLYFKTDEDVQIIEEYSFASSSIEHLENGYSDKKMGQDMNPTDYYSAKEGYSLDIPLQSRGAQVIEVNAGTYKQSYGECWAVSVMLTGKFLTKSNKYTPLQIADKMGIGYNEGAYDSDVVNALSKCYDITGSKKGKLTPNQVKTYMNNQKPGIINWQSTNFAHYTVLCGFSSDSLAGEYGIRVSDSNSGTYKWLYKKGSPSSALNFQYTYGSIVYNWYSTITT